MNEVEDDVSGFRFILSIFICGIFSAVGTACAVLIGPRLYHDGGSSWIGSDEIWAPVAAIYLAPFGFFLGLISSSAVLVFRSTVVKAIAIGSIPNFLVSLFLFVYANGTASKSMTASMAAFAVVGFINGVLALFIYQAFRRPNK